MSLCESLEVQALRIETQEGTVKTIDDAICVVQIDLKKKQCPNYLRRKHGIQMSTSTKPVELYTDHADTVGGIRVLSGSKT
ncbi:hypothetical protein DPMN_017602 [Dreissena polymorpha]|uniref:Uncharacterized protein n=1 Tax=Dreissena polymorpha TaxID=45954 RepID=A0A9D4NFJ0_DREPO|nr:hypothetical protein DPMN_017602 [Dreissena polymorpha]